MDIDPKPIKNYDTTCQGDIEAGGAFLWDGKLYVQNERKNIYTRPICLSDGQMFKGDYVCRVIPVIGTVSWEYFTSL